VTNHGSVEISCPDIGRVFRIGPSAGAAKQRLTTQNIWLKRSAVAFGFLQERPGFREKRQTCDFSAGRFRVIWSPGCLPQPAQRV